MRSRILITSTTLIALLGFGCSSLPAVVSSDPNRVSIEFALDESVASASELADEECEKYGKEASYENVDSVASPRSRIANFNCVDPNAGASMDEAAPSEGDVDDK